MAIQRCPDCGTNYFGDFCPRCHPELIERKPLPPGAKDPEIYRNMVSCVKCGKLLRGDQDFCPACGTKKVLPEPELPLYCMDCGVELEKGQKYCHKCGSRVIDPKMLELEEAMARRRKITLFVFLGIVAVIAAILLVKYMPNILASIRAWWASHFAVKAIRNRL